MSGGEPLVEKDRIAKVLAAHAVGAFNGTDTGCICDRKWRTNAAYAAHLAEAVAEAANPAPRLLAWCDANPGHPLSGRDVAQFLRGEQALRPGQATP